MKRLLILFALCLPLHLDAVGFPDSFIQKASSAMVRMDYSYIASKGGKSYTGSGAIITQDGAYRLESEDIVVYDDLSSNWTLTPSNKEVVITASNAVDFFSNPSEILSLLGLSRRKATVSVSVVPDLTSAVVSAALSDGMIIKVRLTGISFLQKALLSDFTYDTSSLGKGWMITDLR